MTLKEFVSRRTGDFPETGSAGRESDWLAIGEFDVPTGALCVVDPMLMNAEDGVVVRAAPGRYVVEGKAMDFDGHVRVSRLRARLAGAAPTLGPEEDEVGVDSASLAVCDIEDLDDGMDDASNKELADRLNEVDFDGADLIRIQIEKKAVEFAACESGLGDGGYPVFPLRDGKKVVGVEVEFLPRGYVME